ncbi:MAG: response regulator [Anaerolineae bacterium]|nr:response regulator [Anaerolineae bacterium]MDK1119021.1 response regulator [Anaerolineae bacterium]
MIKTILTLDDDKAITELLAMILRTHGYEVITANTGEEGIQAIKDKKPHIVVLDMMMEGMDGFQVCKKIREFSTIPIVVLSAFDDPSMIVNALDIGADEYLVKPVSSSILIAHIEKLIRRTGELELQGKPIIGGSSTQPQTS